MKRWSIMLRLLLWAGLLSAALGAEVMLDQDPQNQQQCSGMYSKKSWGGSKEPVILAKFEHYKPTGQNDGLSDPVIAIVIFEWNDEHLIGVRKSNQTEEKQYVCDQPAIDSGLCEDDDFGQFILAPNYKNVSRSDIKTLAVHLKDAKLPPLSYPILKTGYYCISTARFGSIKYSVIVELLNAYGELPGAQIAKLPFYGGLTIVYAVIGVFWAFLYVQNRHDILPVQNYITATIIFLVVEMLITWAYYDYMNAHGITVGSRVLMIVVSILNAGRNSFSFFLLLIVCMGYGVVKSSLGKNMVYARILAITHFVFGVIYAIASLTIAPEDAGPLVLLVVLPLAATLTAFYVWTLNSLAATMKDLVERKQKTKATMYRRLWWCILASVLVIFGFFFINSFTFAGQDDPDFVPEHWQTRWFVLDGWLNIVYLFDVAFIAYLWRPTANNRRFAMSDELAQDDDGFEIASVRDSLDEDEEAGGRGAPPAYDAMPQDDANGAMKPAHPGPRDASPLPAPKPQRPPANVQPPRDSLDGETIFAVGEDGDKFSDSEGDDEERQGLTRHT